ncbi:MAG TPA: hypothetical protein VN959_09415, partial [Mycobacterium sp.]|nr:hypothetical protein [Mycobacterium sp.]
QEGRGGVLKLRSLVYAVPGGRSDGGTPHASGGPSRPRGRGTTGGTNTGEPDRQVLDWRFTALQF